MKKQSDELLLNGDEAARVLGVRAGTLAQWRFRGIGPSYLRLGGTIVYKRGVLEKYLRDSVVTTDRPVRPSHNRWSRREVVSA